MISIIVPTYNRLTSLKRCVESIIPQQYDGLELIVIDDFSKDDTRLYLTQLSKEYSFIKVLFNNANYGVNYTRNRGIELASKEFILFLDSDDALIDGNLLKIKSNIQDNKLTKHFLFIVSDRKEEFKNVEEKKWIHYEDWLTGKVSGDFTHVVVAGIMKKYLFFEEFRMFEHLNWLRVKKETAPQLLVNIVVAQRERDRTDSLTVNSRLQNADIIKTKFDSENLYYSLYYKDLKLYNPTSLNFKLIYTILLGVASNKKQECRSLIGYAGKWPIKVLGNLAMLLPGSLIQSGIIRYSNMKRR